MTCYTMKPNRTDWNDQPNGFVLKCGIPLDTQNCQFSQEMMINHASPSWRPLGTVAPTICRYSIKPSYILNQTNFAFEIPLKISISSVPPRGGRGPPGARPWLSHCSSKSLPVMAWALPSDPRLWSTNGWWIWYGNSIGMSTIITKYLN